jgi:hypothetical protein
MAPESSKGPTYNTNKLYPVAVVWYADEEQWSRMKAAAEDPELFEESYAAWTKMFEASLVKLEGANVLPIRTAVDAGEYLAWCKADGRPCDASSRSMYAADVMRRAHSSS